MSLLQIPSPDLSAVGAPGSALYLLEAQGFSADGKTLLVRATFAGASPEQLRTGVWLYDLSTQSYTGCLNVTLATQGKTSADIDVVSAQVAGQGAQALTVAQYAPSDGLSDSQLALIQNGVPQDLWGKLGLPNPVSVERYALSADGRFLAVQTVDSVLAPNDSPDTNDVSDIYLIDLQTCKTERVSIVGGAEVIAPVNLGNVVVTGSKVQVSFSTEAKFSADDKNENTPSPSDAYQWSCSFDASGWTGKASFSIVSTAVGASVSAAGGVLTTPGSVLASNAGVWFESTADTLVDGDNNAVSDIFYRASTGVLQKLSLTGITSFSTPPHLQSVSADGSYAAVLTDAPEVLGASPGTPQVPQLLVWQRATQKWTLVSQAAGYLADQDVLSAVMAPNGQWVAFTTSARNLANGDPVAMEGQLFVAPVQDAFNKSPTGAVTITGAAKQGQTLTASNTLADADGMGVIVYQWLADGAAIIGATGTTLVLTASQVGKQISVKASYTDLGLTAESVTSLQTAAVVSVNSAPVATVQAITTNEDMAKPGNLAGMDLDGNTLSFAKLSDPVHGTVVINAQTGAYTYTPAANFNGSDSFTFKVNDGVVDSAAATVSITVNAVNDQPTGSVSITGVAGVDRTLTASNNLSDVDGLGVVAYQWQANGSAIAGATGATLVLAPAQVGKKISVMASYTDGQGTVETVTSAQMTSAVAPTYDFTGLVYEWKTHAVLTGVTLSADGSTVQSNASGHYDLLDLLHSSIGVTASKTPLSSEVQSAITSADVSAALQLAAGRNPNANGAPVTPYQFMAADINGDGKVTSGDALAIWKMVQNANDAPKSEWLFVQESQDFWNEATRAFTTTRNDVVWDKALQFNSPGTHNLVAVLKGDVTGSWSAPAGAVDLDIVNPSYFKDLANQLSTPVTQWGVFGV